MDQKCRHGDLVYIANLPESTRHFQSNVRAIVIYSYADTYGGTDRTSYAVYIEGSGESAWYDEDHMVLLERGRSDLLDEWRSSAMATSAMKGDIDWIFAHGQEVIASPHRASIQALARCLGCYDLWGPLGEGVTYYRNAIVCLAAARPYLISGDKDGWLKLCADIVERNK